jgi:hypothetical protein
MEFSGVVEAFRPLGLRDFVRNPWKSAQQATFCLSDLPLAATSLGKFNKVHDVYHPPDTTPRA